MGVAQAELGRRVEHVRRRVTGAPHINLTSVWFLPAILLLPFALVAVLVVVLSWHLHFRSWYRQKQVAVFRTATSMCTTILTCYVTHAASAELGATDFRSAILAGWAGVATVVVCVATYFLANAALTLPGLYLTSGITNRNITTLIGGWTENLLELATLCLGALTAIALAVLPAVAILVVMPVFILHRAVLIDQLETAARRDDKTGVWNVAGWRQIARQELARAGRQSGTTVGVLMIDLDHFKKINDNYGHLAGDAVLRSVAASITTLVRRSDMVGRFGGEEFVVLLPNIAEQDIRDMAERIRVAITQLAATVQLDDQEHTISGLSASIGIATYPASGSTVEPILQAADTAMYRAKANGRNRVIHIADLRQKTMK
jgi:diguanylate cyclase (GGDEF)-like protein